MENSRKDYRIFSCNYAKYNAQLPGEDAAAPAED
jgi:hypothetical protein